MNYRWNWGVLATEPYLGWLATGLLWTLALSLAAWVLAFLLGSALGIARSAPAAWLRAPAAAYVEVFRNVPLLVQMFLWYFVIPELLPEAAGLWVKRELPLPEFWTAVVALGLYTAARVAEQVRSGIEALPRGQTLAALALGLSRPQAYRLVLLPSAYRLLLPTLTSEFLTIFKNSSLALTIGVAELTFQVRQIESYTFQGFEAFTAATVLYLAITLVVTFGMRSLEQRVAVPGMLGGGR